MYHIEPFIHLVVVPFVALIITQTIKAVMLVSRDKNMTFSHGMNVYGGMPSAHTAYVVSLTAQLLFYDGFSPATGVAIVLAAIVVRDAVGFRRLLGVHSEAINHIMEGLHSSKKKHFPHLTESIGHSPAEAIVGGLVGLAISVFATLFL